MTRIKIDSTAWAVADRRGNLRTVKTRNGARQYCIYSSARDAEDDGEACHGDWVVRVLISNAPEGGQ